MATRVVMTLLVRNEEDVMADNILFSLFPGNISFLGDDLSMDATPVLLRRLAKLV